MVSIPLIALWHLSSGRELIKSSSFVASSSPRTKIGMKLGDACSVPGWCDNDHGVLNILVQAFESSIVALDKISRSDLTKEYQIISGNGNDNNRKDVNTAIDWINSHENTDCLEYIRRINFSLIFKLILAAFDIVDPIFPKSLSDAITKVKWNNDKGQFSDYYNLFVELRDTNRAPYNALIELLRYLKKLAQARKETSIGMNSDELAHHFTTSLVDANGISSEGKENARNFIKFCIWYIIL